MRSSFLSLIWLVRRRLAAVIVIVATCTLGTRAAGAEPVAGADLQTGAVVSKDGSGVALGGAATVGYAIRGSRWFLIPEARVGYLRVDRRGDADPFARNMVRFAGGARLGWLGRASPSVHLHAGYGRVWGTDDDYGFAQYGPTCEIGAALDFAVSRHVAFGPRVGAGAMLASQPNSSRTEVTPWIVGGLQFVVSIGDPPETSAPLTARRQ